MSFRRRELDDEPGRIMRQIRRTGAAIARQRALAAKLEHQGQDATRGKELLSQFAELPTVQTEEHNKCIKKHVQRDAEVHAFDAARSDSHEQTRDRQS